MSLVRSVTHQGHRQLRWLDSPDPCHSDSERRGARCPRNDLTDHIQLSERQLYCQPEAPTNTRQIAVSFD